MSPVEPLSRRRASSPYNLKTRKKRGDLFLKQELIPLLKFKAIYNEILIEESISSAVIKILTLEVARVVCREVSRPR